MKNNFRIIIKNIFILCSSALLFFSSLVHSATPADNTINIGMTTALSGPARTLGISMRQGVEAYFNKINANGGIKGKMLKLIVMDDEYEPELAGHNMRDLIDKQNVIAVIGNVGTPTAALTVPIANEKRTLLFGALTGADLLRKNPPDRYVINLRASYKEETLYMIKNLLALGIKPDEIAFFTQNDAYGDAAYDGAMESLKETGYAHPESLPHGRYTRNTINVEGGLALILEKANKSIKAVIIAGTYEPSAKFIEIAKKEYPDALFLNISFVSTTALSRALNKNSHNVIVTQVVPFFDMSLTAVQEYRKDLKKYMPAAQPGFVSLEGYLVAKLFVLGLQKAVTENKLTREGLIDVFESMHDVDIGIGEKINFDHDHHQALHAIWPTTLENGKPEPLNWSDIATTSPSPALKPQ